MQLTSVAWKRPLNIFGGNTTAAEFTLSGQKGGPTRPRQLRKKEVSRKVTRLRMRLANQFPSRLKGELRNENA